ncbi:lysylphosphatidylglycerol synthase transmembrane domain-containing protein [Arhodomonas sp. AD133]|uniref:lysylphosphatidylglycerol synthase transmembrane domain-containing protein n=1 Tax=Arhodomonas sp. AD133 TaxID=3415009 RepID=UPI003EB81589
MRYRYLAPLARWLRPAAAIGILAAIVWWGDGLAAHWAVLGTVEPLVVGTAFVVVTADRLLMAYKWVLLLRSAHLSLGVLRATQIYCAAMVWGLFLPSTLGADAIRTVCAQREGLPGSTVVASIVLERALGFVASAALAAIAIALLAASTSVDGVVELMAWPVIVALLGLIAAVGASLSDWPYRLIRRWMPTKLSATRAVKALFKVHEAYLGFRDHRGTLLAFLLLSVAEGLLTVAIFWVLTLGLALPVSFPVILAAVFSAFLVSRLPISVAGIGVFEGVFVMILALHGIPSTQSLTLALLARVLQILAWLPWWLGYSFTMGRPAIARPRA